MHVRSSFFASLLFSSSIAALAGCSSARATDEGSFPADPYATVQTTESAMSLELRTAPAQPPVRGTTTAELRVRDRAGGASEGLAVNVTAWMPAHGHGAAHAPTVVALGGGAYRVDTLELPMAGTWELRIQIQGKDGEIEHATATIEVR